LNGNSVITGHVYNSNGLPGPFVNLNKLKWGDKIYINAFGQKYIYEVRAVNEIQPNDSSVLAHKDLSWITLLTCKDYNEITQTYASRIAAQAVLISVVKP
jgi:sortase A